MLPPMPTKVFGVRMGFLPKSQGAKDSSEFVMGLATQDGKATEGFEAALKAL